jgi:hypothetical protein
MFVLYLSKAKPLIELKLETFTLQKDSHSEITMKKKKISASVKYNARDKKIKTPIV